MLGADQATYEQIVEFDKGTSGAGMTLMWDRERGDVVVNGVVPNGAAQRARIQPGDKITAIQGQCVDGHQYKQVIKMLQNVACTPKANGVKDDLKELLKFLSEQRYRTFCWVRNQRSCRCTAGC